MMMVWALCASCLLAVMVVSIVNQKKSKFTKHLAHDHWQQFSIAVFQQPIEQELKSSRGSRNDGI